MLLDPTNVNKLHRALIAAGIPVLSVNSDFEVEFAPEATEAQRTLAAQIVAAHDPVDDEGQRKRSAIESLEDINFKAWADSIRASNLSTIQKTNFLRMIKACWLLTTAILGLAAEDPGE